MMDICVCLVLLLSSVYYSIISYPQERNDSHNTCCIQPPTPIFSLSPLSPLHPISYLINEIISLSLWNERTNSTMGCCTHDPIMGIRRGTTIPILHLGNTHGRCYQGHALSSLLASVLIICCTIPHRHFRRAKCIP